MARGDPNKLKLNDTVKFNVTPDGKLSTVVDKEKNIVEHDEKLRDKEKNIVEHEEKLSFLKEGKKKKIIVNKLADNGFNLFAWSFPFMLTDFSRKCVDFKFKLKATDSRPTNVAIGIYRQLLGGPNNLDPREIYDILNSTIGNTANCCDSFGMHGDDGSRVVSSKDKGDPWKDSLVEKWKKSRLCINEWWPSIDETTQVRGDETTQLSIGYDIGEDNETIFFVILPQDNKRILLPGINTLFPEWFKKSEETWFEERDGYRYIPVISFEYDDDYKNDIPFEMEVTITDSLEENEKDSLKGGAKRVRKTKKVLKRKKKRKPKNVRKGKMKKTKKGIQTKTRKKTKKKHKKNKRRKSK